MHVLVIDNYDSFTYNLLHLLEGMDVSFHVVQNDQLAQIESSDFSHLLICPGPGLPEESGQLLAFLDKWPEHKPVLGVCLGMQALLISAGGHMTNLLPVYHGAREHLFVQDHSDLFLGLPDHFKVGRYHSWGFYQAGMPEHYSVTATDSEGIVMAVTHSEWPWFGVQFHPESIITQFGRELLTNFLESNQRKKQKSNAQVSDNALSFERTSC